MKQPGGPATEPSNAAIDALMQKTVQDGYRTTQFAVGNWPDTELLKVTAALAAATGPWAESRRILGFRPNSTGRSTSGPVMGRNALGGGLTKTRVLVRVHHKR